MSAVIKCPQCGATIQDDGKFCKYCGAKLPEEPSQKQELKRHEILIERINHTKIRREEIKKEREKQAQEAELKRLEELRKKEIEERKTFKLLFGIIGIALFVLLIMYLTGK